MQNEIEKRELRAAGKRIELFCAPQPCAPLIVYHAAQGESSVLWDLCRAPGVPRGSLAVVNDMNWNEEMSPWPIPPLRPQDPPFAGGADAYLARLTGEILPAVYATLGAAPSRQALAGYSLAGLFAVYAAYQTDAFGQIASASGSLWYPGLLDFARAHRMNGAVKSAYFSLGDKESRTRNAMLAPVEDNTRALVQIVQEAGVATTFESNPGNHFRDAAPRMARGIRWLLAQNGDR